MDSIGYFKYLSYQNKNIKNTSANSSQISAKNKENSRKQSQKSLRNKLEYNSPVSNQRDYLSKNGFQRMKLNGGRSPRDKKLQNKTNISNKETNVKTEGSIFEKKEQTGLGMGNNVTKQMIEYDVCRSLEVDDRGYISLFNKKMKNLNTGTKANVNDKKTKLLKNDPKDTVIENLNSQIFKLENKILELTEIIKDNGLLNNTCTYLNTETTAVGNALLTAYNDTDTNTPNILNSKTISPNELTENKNFKNKILSISKIQSIKTKFTNMKETTTTTTTSTSLNKSKNKYKVNKNLVINIESSNGLSNGKGFINSNVGKNSPKSQSQMNKYSKAINYLNLNKPFQFNKTKHMTVMDIYNKSIENKQAQKSSVERADFKINKISVKSMSPSPSRKLNRKNFLYNEININDEDLSNEQIYEPCYTNPDQSQNNQKFKPNNLKHLNTLQSSYYINNREVSQINKQFNIIKEKTKNLLEKYSENNLALIKMIQNKK